MKAEKNPIRFVLKTLQKGIDQDNEVQKQIGGGKQSVYKKDRDIDMSDVENVLSDSASEKDSVSDKSSDKHSDSGIDISKDSDDKISEEDSDISQDSEPDKKKKQPFKQMFNIVKGQFKGDIIQFGKKYKIVDQDEIDEYNKSKTEKKIIYKIKSKIAEKLGEKLHAKGKKYDYNEGDSQQMKKEKEIQYNKNNEKVKKLQGFVSMLDEKFNNYSDKKKSQKDKKEQDKEQIKTDKANKIAQDKIDKANNKASDKQERHIKRESTKDRNNKKIANVDNQISILTDKLKKSLEKVQKKENLQLDKMQLQIESTTDETIKKQLTNEFNDKKNKMQTDIYYKIRAKMDDKEMTNLSMGLGMLMEEQKYSEEIDNLQKDNLISKEQAEQYKKQIDKLDPSIESYKTQTADIKQKINKDVAINLRKDIITIIDSYSPKLKSVVQSKKLNTSDGSYKEDPEIQQLFKQREEDVQTQIGVKLRGIYAAKQRLVNKFNEEIGKLNTNISNISKEQISKIATYEQQIKTHEQSIQDLNKEIKKWKNKEQEDLAQAVIKNMNIKQADDKQIIQKYPTFSSSDKKNKSPNEEPQDSQYSSKFNKTFSEFQQFKKQNNVATSPIKDFIQMDKQKIEEQLKSALENQYKGTIEQQKQQQKIIEQLTQQNIDNDLRNLPKSAYEKQLEDLKKENIELKEKIGKYDQAVYTLNLSKIEELDKLNNQQISNKLTNVKQVEQAELDKASKIKQLELEQAEYKVKHEEILKQMNYKGLELEKEIFQRNEHHVKSEENNKQQQTFLQEKIQKLNIHTLEQENKILELEILQHNFRKNDTTQQIFYQYNIQQIKNIKNDFNTDIETVQQQNSKIVNLQQKDEKNSILLVELQFIIDQLKIQNTTLSKDKDKQQQLQKEYYEIYDQYNILKKQLHKQSLEQQEQKIPQQIDTIKELILQSMELEQQIQKEDDFIETSINEITEEKQKKIEKLNDDIKLMKSQKDINDLQTQIKIEVVEKLEEYIKHINTFQINSYQVQKQQNELSNIEFIRFEYKQKLDTYLQELQNKNTNIDYQNNLKQQLFYDLSKDMSITLISLFENISKKIPNASKNSKDMLNLYIKQNDYIERLKMYMTMGDLIEITFDPQSIAILQENINDLQKNGNNNLITTDTKNKLKKLANYDKSYGKQLQQTTDVEIIKQFQEYIKSRNGDKKSPIQSSVQQVQQTTALQQKPQVQQQVQQVQQQQQPITTSTTTPIIQQQPITTSTTTPIIQQQQQQQQQPITTSTTTPIIEDEDKGFNFTIQPVAQQQSQPVIQQQQKPAKQPAKQPASLIKDDNEQVNFSTIQPKTVSDELLKMAKTQITADKKADKKNDKK